MCFLLLVCLESSWTHLLSARRQKGKLNVTAPIEEFEAYLVSFSSKFVKGTKVLCLEERIWRKKRLRRDFESSVVS